MKYNLEKWSIKKFKFQINILEKNLFLNSNFGNKIFHKNQI